MATKIFALFALIALSFSATTAVIIPQYSPAPNAIIQQLLSPLTPMSFEHPAVQAFRLQQALTASILQQPIAQLHQQSSAHLSVHTVAVQQQPQFQPALSQLAVGNPIAFLQQQLLASNALAQANAVVYQQQQLQQVLSAIIQQAMVNPAACLQQQQWVAPNALAVANAAAYVQQQLQQILLALTQLAVANPAAYLQQQQLDPFNQLALGNIAAYLQQQQQLPVNPLAVANPLATAFLQQQQQQWLPFNQISLMSPTLSWQRPIF